MVGRWNVVFEPEIHITPGWINFMSNSVNKGSMTPVSCFQFTCLAFSCKQGEGGQLRESREREDLRLHAILRKKTSGLTPCFSSPRMSYLSEESLEILLLASDVGYLLRILVIQVDIYLVSLVHPVLAHALTRQNYLWGEFMECFSVQYRSEAQTLSYWWSS